MNRHPSSGRNAGDQSEEGDSDSPIAEGSIDALDAARKKRPRCFLIIAKGSKLVYFLARRKPIRKTDVETAKRDGFKGEASVGIVRGQGRALEFHLSRDEGYDRAPVKELVLEMFLRKHGDFKCEPTFVLGDELPPLEFEDADRKHPLVRRFLQLEDDLRELAPPLAQKIGNLPTRLKTLRELLIEGNFVQAKSHLSELEDEVEQAEQLNPDATGSDATAASREEAITRQLKTFTAKLNRISAHIQSAIQAAPDQKRQLLEPLAQFQQAIQVRDPAAARQALSSIAQQLAEQQANTRDQAEEENQAQPHDQGDSPEKLAAAWDAAQDEFRDAIANTQSQLAGLATALLKTGDADLAWIAEEGFTELLAELRGAAVALAKCASRDPNQMAKRAQPIVAQIRKWLADPRVVACNEDELAGSSRISDAIHRAVQSLDETLRQAAGTR